MVCEQCHVLMTERLPDPKTDDAEEERAIVLSCPECGHTEYQPVIASFWRRLAA